MKLLTSPKVFFKMYLFSYYYCFLLWSVFVAARGLSAVAASWDHSLLLCVGFSLRRLLLLQSTGSKHSGFSSCSTWTQQLWHMGFLALCHVGSSRSRDEAGVPFVARQILQPWTTGEAPEVLTAQSAQGKRQHLTLECSKSSNSIF